MTPGPFPAGGSRIRPVPPNRGKGPESRDAIFAKGLFLKYSNVVTVAQIDRFDEVIDVRSPSEFALDHFPGAINAPVLDDEERARVGTIYKQISPFQAKKIGAALVSRNIGRHIEDRFASRVPTWKPLVYCWRGGKRSAAMAHVLREIGWEAEQLEGGYKAYRREVVARLQLLPERFSFQVICGATGSGKSRLLESLAAHGAQVLDLERLACHRGSVLGDLPQFPQPSQKMFESLVWRELRRMDLARPVFVEAESKKIGQLQIPSALIDRMRAGRCVQVDVPLAARVEFLMSEYHHFLEHPEMLKEKLLCLSGLYGKEVIDRWIAQVQSGAWNDLVGDLLVQHYDPAYRRSTLRNFLGFHEARVLEPESLSPEALSSAAEQLVRAVEHENG